VRRRSTLWAAALVAVAALAASPTAFAADTATSSNWAGYALSGDSAPMSFKKVAGTWVQPAASCAAVGGTYSAFWVGLGGLSEDSQALEQIGTESDCRASGTPTYSAWYELVPAAPVELTIKVRPGDTLSASVTVIGKTIYLRLRNVTRKTLFTKTLRMAAPDVSSAEWIAEAPSSCDSRGCQALPLANFGTVSFSRATATANGHAGTISDPAWLATAIELRGGGAGFARGRFTAAVPDADAIPAPLSSDGGAFSVTWQEAASELPAP
jgi:hypothetical protein